MLHPRILPCLLLVLTAVGCAPPTYWQDAKPIIDARCANCHRPGDIAPFALDDVDAAMAMHQTLAPAVESGSMPPWKPDDSCNSYADNTSLSADEEAILLDWLSAGAPEGNPDQPAVPLDGAVDLSIEWDLSLSMSEDYLPTRSPDDYRCIVMDWTETEAKYVTGFQLRPGRRDMVHHAIAYAIDPAATDAYRSADGQDGLSGFPCFGSPLPNDTNYDGMRDAHWLASWVPGRSGDVFPEGTGILVQPGSLIVLQMHYNTLVPEPGADRSSVDFLLADTVAKPSMVLPMTEFRWIIGSTPMTIPAGAADVSHSTTLDIFGEALGYLGGSALGVTGDGGLLIHRVGLHMHTRGSQGLLRVDRADGSRDCALRIRSWDFNWQGFYTLEQPLLMQPEDRAYLECHWDNSQANQPVVNGQQVEARDLAWGDGTDDEMCLGIFMVSDGAAR